jgi:hypothetical protein
MNGIFTMAAVSISSQVIPLSAGIITYRRLIPVMKILFYLIVLISLVEVYTLYQVWHKTAYEWIHYVYLPFEYGLFAIIFSNWQSNTVKTILLGSIPVFALICLANAISVHSFSRTNSFVTSVACGLYVIMSTNTLYNLQKRSLRLIIREPRFWVSSALLLYAAGALSYFAFLEMLPTNLLIIAWYFHGALSIVTNLFYAGAFLCHYHR